MCPDPGGVRCCCGCRWPWPVPGHTDGQGCRGGGHSTAPGKPQPASCPLQGYSRPRVTPGPGLLQTQRSSALLGLSPPFPGNPQHPRSLFSLRLAHTPCCPQPHSPETIEGLPQPSPSCCPLPSAAAVRLRVCLLGRRVWTLTWGLFLWLSPFTLPVILGLPPPTWEGRTPPQGHLLSPGILLSPSTWPPRVAVPSRLLPSSAPWEGLHTCGSVA